MKKIYFLIMVLFLITSCGKKLPESQNNPTQTGETTQEQVAPDISLEEVSDQTGITPEELGELMDENISLLSSSGTIIEARGTEPFWYFTASGSTLVWTSLGGLDMVIETLTGITLTSSGTSYSVSGGGINGNITLGTCSDGMSDLVYDYNASVTKGITNFNGCANVD